MRYLLVALAMTLLPGKAPHATIPIALFNTAEIRTESHDGLRQWQAVLDRLSRERPLYDRCLADPAACPSRAAQSWQIALSELRGASLQDKIVGVNRFVNKVRYRSDDAVYGTSDYWATPFEFFRHTGDCEDYAIAKYLSLRLLGVPEEQLRLAVVHDRLRDLAHAVLVVYTHDTAVVLDNLTNAILPHDRVTNYIPYYTVNKQARWTHVPSSRINMSALAR